MLKLKELGRDPSTLETIYEGDIYECNKDYYQIQYSKIDLSYIGMSLNSEDKLSLVELTSNGKYICNGITSPSLKKPLYKRILKVRFIWTPIRNKLDKGYLIFEIMKGQGLPGHCFGGLIDTGVDQSITFPGSIDKHMQFGIPDSGHSMLTVRYPVTCDRYYLDAKKGIFEVYSADIINNFIKVVDSELFNKIKHSFSISPKDVDYSVYISDDEVARTVILEWREE